MSPLPSSITHAQKLAAVRALGLDPMLVTSLALDATEGVAVTVHVRDRRGNVVVQGEGEPAEASLFIPYAGPRIPVGTYADPDATVPGE